MGMRSNVEQLNSLLRSELAAVETYRIALARLDTWDSTRRELEACMQSHEDRVVVLRDAVLSIGGVPIDGVGLIDETEVTLEALTEGEDHRLKDYRDEIDEGDIDQDTRDFMATQLWPAQKQTYARLSALRKQMH